MSALDDLRDRLAELADLTALGHLADWDQRTMMPTGGAPARAQHLATLQRVAHVRGAADEIGGWLSALEQHESEFDDVDRDIVRVARRDWERRRRVPADLAADLAQAAAEGQAVWLRTRANSDFAAFAPTLRRNLQLARDYAACFEDADRAYDALLDDYDYGLTAQRLQEIFRPLAETLPGLVAEGASRRVTALDDVPEGAQRAAVHGVLRRVGVDDHSWRVDVSAHPFTTWLGPHDTRLATRYEGGQLESVMAALHEFGHGLYDRQIAPELNRTNLGGGTSMSVHESQSKLWENHVGRNPAFASVLAAQLGTGGFVIEAETLHAALAQVRPSAIRVSADQVTYPLHIALRFELELELIEGTLEVDELPAAWNEGMRRLLGVEVSDDANGVLQDVHWAVGAFGYFPSYALGCVIAAQLWEALESELGRQDEQLRRGDVLAIQGWLGERVHRHGRRLDTEPLLRQATGQALSVEPLLRHLRTQYALA